MVTLTGTFTRLDGTPATGTVRVTPSRSPIMDSAGRVVISGPQVFPLDKDGKLTTEIPASNDPDLGPAFTYAIDVNLTHASWKISKVWIPHGSATVDLSEIGDYQPVPGVATRVVTIPADGTDGQVLVWDGAGFSWQDTLGPADIERYEHYTEVADRFEQLVFGSSNLFDKTMITPDMVIPAGSGTPIENTQYVVSDPIEVVAGADYTFVEVLRVTYFNDAGDYMHNTDLHMALAHRTVPAGVATARLSVRKVDLDIAQMNRGDTLLPYEPGGRETHIRADLIDPAVTAPVSPRRTTFFDLSSNLFDKTAITPDVALPPASGTPIPNTQHVVSDHIEVVAGADYTFVEVLRVTYFNDAGDYVHNTDLNATLAHRTVPAGVATARLSVNKAYLDTAQMNRGDTLLPYEPGGAKLKPELVPDPVVDVKNADRYLLDTAGLAETYDAPTIEAQRDLDATTTADVYGWYDQLMADHPDYVTRENLGEASDGTALYAYTLKPVTVPTETNSTRTPAFLAISGVHGYEKAAVYHLWRFAKALCDEWETSPVLDAIRWNIEIVIVPVACPYGYDLSDNSGPNIRTNANGVDIARNFPAYWRPSEPGTPTYGGTAPLTEPEAIILDQLMADMADRTVWAGSFHNFSAQTEAPWQFIWQASASQLTLHVGKKLISRMSRKWRAEHAWVTIPDPYYGYADMGAPAGSEGRQLVAYGIQGSTFETSRLQLLDGGAGVRHTSEAMTLGLEATVNYIAMAIVEGVRFRNESK